MIMKLTKENYFSREADEFYLSASQYNSFQGTPAINKCEAASIAKLRGDWSEEPSVAMLMGSYVDSYFDDSLVQFKVENSQIYTQKGDLRAEYKKAEEIIQAAESDLFFMKYVRGSGRSQVIVTGEIGGNPWKGKIDRLHEGLAIVDLKVIASIRDKVWIAYSREWMNFVEAYGYLNQAAIYQELWKQQSGEKLPFFIAAITKEKVPDKEVIHIPDEMLDIALDEIKRNAQYVADLKSGKYPPVHCGKCDYCRSVHKLENTISLLDLY